MYNVFVDQHHMGLYNSLRMLFEDRLGGKLFRPIGTAWMEKGYWKMAEIYRNHPATVAQYLGIPDALFNSSGIYSIEDTQHHAMTHALTVEAFMQTPIDIVIATLPMHIESFARLAAQHPNHPKFIFQIGNAWNVPPGAPVKNVMASAVIHEPIPAGTNIVTYHQEFDEKIFTYWLDWKCPEGQEIASFVNCFSTDGNYAGDWELFQQIEKLMPDWSFKTFGGSCRDGSIGPIEELATNMRLSKFIWHTKYGGDGYGHVLYNSAAVARPIITKVGYYFGKMGHELMQDGVTCIGIDGLTNEQIVEKIQYFSEPDRYITMCRNVRANYENKVNFNTEFQQLQHFLKNLL